MAPPSQELEPPINPERFSTLTKASLKGARLIGMTLAGTDLVGASLDGAHLNNAKLDRAFLVGASLANAHLDGATLEGAFLEGAFLRGIGGDGASLIGASLEDAWLDGAKLAGMTRLNEIQISKAWGSAETELPNGCKRPRNERWAERGIDDKDQLARYMSWKSKQTKWIDTWLQRETRSTT
jgi:uncharacterized protein YjbI with pentapeptide repeats